MTMRYALFIILCVGLLWFLYCEKYLKPTFRVHDDLNANIKRCDKLFNSSNTDCGKKLAIYDYVDPYDIVLYKDNNEDVSNILTSRLIYPSDQLSNCNQQLQYNIAIIHVKNSDVSIDDVLLDTVQKIIITNNYALNDISTLESNLSDNGFYLKSIYTDLNNTKTKVYGRYFGHCKYSGATSSKMKIDGKYINFDNIKTEPIQTLIHPHRYIITPSRQNIPRNIFQTNISDNIPTSMKFAIQSIQSESNNGYIYKYFTDDECVEYLKQHFQPDVLLQYNSLIPGAFKCDVFRLCVLLIEGGIYVDTGMLKMKNTDFNEMIGSKSDLLLCIDCSDNGIYQAIIGSTKNNEVIRKCLNHILNNIRQKHYGINPLDITGPMAIGRVIRQFFPENTLPLTPGTYKLTNGQYAKLLTHDGQNGCMAGTINDEYGKIYLYTKYKGYNIDRASMTSSEFVSYGTLYDLKKVFK